jgi:hypothetical protein
MHFATADPTAFERDGAIWAVNFAQAHTRLPTHLKPLLKAEGSDLFTVEMLATIFTRLEQPEAYQRSAFILFF